MVFRCEVFELIQYAPQTDKVWSVPLLMVPPVINKFYIMDIAPGRSMIEYFLRQGHAGLRDLMAQSDCGTQNVGVRHLRPGDPGRAGRGARRSRNSDRTHLQASCSGGILAAMTAAHLTATGEGDRLAGSDVDGDRCSTRGRPVSPRPRSTRRPRTSRSPCRRSKGYLDGRSLAEVFAWLRPTDLVWRYWVNNYVEGKSPAAFDVLFWNADTTRMAAALHRDMVMLGVHNALATPGAVSMLGTPVDLRPADRRRVCGRGIADHISPWQACYRSARLLGSKDLRFVLSSERPHRRTR